MTNPKSASEPTEGDLLCAELAKAGRYAFPGSEGGATYVIMAVDPAAPNVESEAYGVPHLLMYAGEEADRPASEHREPWSAHLHGAEGDYVASVYGGSLVPLDAVADAERCAAGVVAWLRAYLGDSAADGANT